MKKCIKIAYQSFSFITCKALHNTKRRGKSTLSLCHCFSHSSFEESFLSSVLEDSFFSSFSSFLDGCSSFFARLARSPVINPAAAGCHPIPDGCADRSRRPWRWAPLPGFARHSAPPELQRHVREHSFHGQQLRPVRRHRRAVRSARFLRLCRRFRFPVVLQIRMPRAHNRASSLSSRQMSQPEAESMSVSQEIVRRAPMPIPAPS